MYSRYQARHRRAAMADPQDWSAHGIYIYAVCAEVKGVIDAAAGRMLTPALIFLLVEF